MGQGVHLSDFHNLFNQSVEYFPLKITETFFIFVLSPSITSLPCPGDLTPSEIIILYACDNNESK